MINARPPDPVENLPDTPANAQVFGYPHNGHGDGPFPQAQIVYLVECGTHAIVDAGIWPILGGRGTANAAAWPRRSSTPTSIRRRR